LNPVFEILPEIHEPELTRIYCELSDESFSYFFQNEKNKLVTGLAVYHFDKINKDFKPSQKLKKILEEQDLCNGNKEVIISYAYPECLIVPAAYYDGLNNEENLSMVYGDLEPGIVLSDEVKEKNIYCVYRIPEDVHETISSQFPSAKSTHQFSSLIKNIHPSENSLHVIFYQQKIVIRLVINGELQILQSYQYKTPEDVVFHILNVCENFEVKEVGLQLYGMIEKDSALFRELHKYFLNIHFGPLPGRCNYAEGIKEFPAHYFSHLFSLAPCE
jgi:hypothetical protein